MSCLKFYQKMPGTEISYKIIQKSMKPTSKRSHLPLWDVEL